MATNILMPALSPTMTEGTLARWLKNEGDLVRAGDIIAEIETDKATMEVEAVDEGVLGKILVPGGTAGVKVNEVIAVLVEKGEVFSGAAAAAPAPSVVAAPVVAAVAAAAPAPVAAASHGERAFASPLARRMAQQAGLDVTKIAGSGPQGRVVKADIEAAMNRPAAVPAPVAAAAPVAAPAPAPRPVAAAAAAPIAGTLRCQIAACARSSPSGCRRAKPPSRISMWRWILSWMRCWICGPSSMRGRPRMGRALISFQLMT
jgi:pyruvate dehydrogenase E2 component (dihydrolipoamide acetyltransferase)